MFPKSTYIVLNRESNAVNTIPMAIIDFILAKDSSRL